VINYHITLHVLIFSDILAGNIPQNSFLSGRFRASPVNNALRNETAIHSEMNDGFAPFCDCAGQTTLRIAGLAHHGKFLSNIN